MSYTKSLVNTLVTQSHNKLFYQGNVAEGAKVLTKEVVRSVHANRCSIWMYASTTAGDRARVTTRLYSSTSQSFIDAYLLSGSATQSF